MSGDFNRGFNVGSILTLDDTVGVLYSDQLPTETEPGQNVPKGSLCVVIRSGFEPQVFQKLSDTDLDWFRVGDQRVGDLLTTSRELQPPEYLKCDGSQYSSTIYADLVSEIGETIGLVRQPNPATVPSSSGWCCLVDPSEQLFIVGVSGAQRILIYSIGAGGALTYVGQPSGTLPSDSVRGMAMTPDGALLIAVSEDSPNNTAVYDRSGTSLTYNSTLSTLFSNAVPGTISQVAISPDGNYVVFASQDDPHVIWFKKNGASYTQLAQPATIPQNKAHSVGFRSDSLQFTVGHEQGNYFITYNIVNDVAVAITTIQGGFPDDRIYAVKYRDDDNSIILASKNNPHIVRYRQDGNTLIRIDDTSAIMPPNDSWSLDMTDNEESLFVGHQDPPYLSAYKMNGVIHKLADPDVLPSGTVYGVSVANSVDSLYIAQSQPPYIARYLLNSKLATPNLENINSNGIALKHYIRTGLYE